MQYYVDNKIIKPKPKYCLQVATQKKNSCDLDL